ncbi:MAG TPA: adenylyl-sulfate kinase [Anaerolineae bacterium]|nr:adenylyl-sulfate kinase [Anaerolineae bacterium]
MTTTSPLIAPYGGKLVDLMVPAESLAELKAYAGQLPSIQISPRAACDLELLATGAFSPLDRFMGQADHRRVLAEMRLADGHIFPIPVTLAVDARPDLRLDQDIALRNNEYELLAIMTVEEIYEWDRTEVSDQVFGTQDLRHPVVAELQGWGKLNISGRLQVLSLPRRYHFQDLWLTPAQTRARLAELKQPKVVAFQPHSSWQRLDQGLSEEALNAVEGTLLLQPAAGLTKAGDIDYYTRIRFYQTLADRDHQPNPILLSLLPLATRLAGPREALWHALIRRNYGANHLIVSRDHASPELVSRHASEGTTFYGPAEAQALVEKYSQETGVKIVPEGDPATGDVTVSKGSFTASILNTPPNTAGPLNGHAGPEWATRREVAELLNEIYLPRHRQGVCLWFTGLSGAGKSTTAEILTWLLLDHGRRVTVLDGDVVRTHLSKGLGYSKEDRDINVRRIGFVAAELVRLGGVVVCAVVSPYRAARNQVRTMLPQGHFVEVFVDTPLEICEARDVKGMYARARRGDLKGFTGIDDPYEAPDHPEIRLDTVNYTPHENATFIIDYLSEQGFIHLKSKQTKKVKDQQNR